MTLTKDRGHKGVFINEDLTKARSTLLYEARRRGKSGQLKVVIMTNLGQRQKSA